MKKTIILSLFALSASTAFAADAVYEAPVAPSVEAPILFTWTGAYAGIQGGYAWTTLKDSEFNDKFKLNGGLVGGFIGYNHQLENNLVLGIEGDLGYNFGKKKVRSDFLDTVELGTGLDGSVRARVGFAADRTLFYATGGWATVRAYQEESIANARVEKVKATYNGYTIGAGIEQAFTDTLFGRVEYRYTDYGSKTWDGVKVDLDQHAVKVGLGVKF